MATQARGSLEALTIETLQNKYRFTDEQFDTEIEETDLPLLSPYFDNAEDYVELLELLPAEKSDVERKVIERHMQAGVKLALKLWRKKNPLEATYRALLKILLDLEKGTVAVEVCKCLHRKKSSASTQGDLSPPEAKRIRLDSQSSDLPPAMPEMQRTFENFLASPLPPEERKRQAIPKLYLESAELEAKFRKLDWGLYKSLKSRENVLEDLVVCVTSMNTLQPLYKAIDQPMFEKRELELTEAKSVGEIWKFIRLCCSFFNYNVIEFITECLGTDQDKQNMEQYKEDFKAYANRMVYECPAEFGYTNEVDSTLVVKLDDTYDNCTLNQLELFKKKLCDILKLQSNSLRLCTAEHGCYKLTFQAPSFVEEVIFPLSKEQQIELGNLGVVWIECGDHEYHTALKKKSDDTGDGNSSDDDGNDPDNVSQRTISVQSNIYSAYHTKQSSGPPSDSGIGRTNTETLSENTEELFAEDFSADQSYTSQSHNLPVSTHLNVAAFNGSLATVQFCVEVIHNDPLTQSGEGGKTALHVAAEGGHLNITKYLSEHCTMREMSVAIFKTDIGKTTLHIAALNGHLSLVKYFIETVGMDPMLQDYNLGTPLLDACRSGNIEVVEYLLAQVQLLQPLDSTIRETTNVGSTLLHFAASSGNCALLQLLITKFHVSPNVSSKLGAIPFHVAAQEGHLNVLRFLASLKDCNIFCSTELGSYNALHFCSKEGHLDIIKYLCSDLGLNPRDQDSFGRTPLHLAALNGHLDNVQYFIEENQVEADLPDYKGLTPLHYASLRGKLPIVKFLMENCGCSATCLSKNKETPLHIASSNGHVDLVKYFTQHQNVDPLFGNIYNKTPLHLAVKHNHTSVILYYIRELFLKLRTPDRFGEKILYSAVEKGNLSIVTELGARLKWMGQQTGFRQSHLLHIAVCLGHLNVVRYLMCIKKWQYTIFATADQDSLLNLAAFVGQLHIVQFLIEELQYDPTGRNKRESTSLNEACYNGHVNVIEYLYENTKLDNSYVDEKGMTPLHYAASQGQLKAVECLTTRFNCDITREDNNGNTALHCATANGHFEVVRFFVSTLQQSTELPGRDKFTLLHIATLYQHIDIVEYLLDNNCEVFPVDSMGYTPAFYLTRYGHLEMLEIILSKAGATLMHTDNNGLTLLHHAAIFNQLLVLKCLIDEYSLDPNITSNTGITPLHLACEHGHESIACFLVNECKCTMLQTTTAGAYPIHMSAQAGQLNIFKWLTEHLKIDPLCRDNDGNTPLHYAVGNSQVNIIDFCFQNLNTSPSITNNKGYTLLHSITVLSTEITNITKPQLPTEIKTLVEFIQHLSSNKPEVMENSAKINKQEVIVQQLLKYGFDPTTKTSLGNGALSPLHFAAFNGLLEIVKMFLSVLQEKGISPHIPDGDQMTPLHHACAEGHTKVVDVLTQQAKGRRYSVPLDVDSETPLHFAAKNGHLNIVKLLTIQKSHSIHCKDNRELTPLHCAVIRGHFDIVKFLITEFPVNPFFGPEVTLFELACLAGHTNIATYFFRQFKEVKIEFSNILLNSIRTGRVDIVRYITSLKRSETKSLIFQKHALHLAAMYGQLKAVIYLITELRFKPSKRGAKGMTPLHVACFNGHENVAKYLLSLPNCDPKAFHTVSKYTALHFASEKGLLDVIKILTEQKGCNTLARNKSNNTSLHLAATYGHLNVVKFFTVKLKCDPSIRGEDGWTPFLLAANYGHLQVVKFLVSKFNINIDVHEQYVDKATALHLACRNGNLDVVDYLSDLYKSRNTEQPLDADRETPLHYAARAGHLAIVKLLTLKWNYDPNQKETDRGNTPLHLAAKEGHGDVVNFLVTTLHCNPFACNNYFETSVSRWRDGQSTIYEFGYKNRTLHKAAENDLMSSIKVQRDKLNIEQCDKLGRTPLHYAAMADKLIALSKLLKLGANPLAVDVFQNLPIHYAAALGHSRLTLTLLKYCKSAAVCSRGVFNMNPIDMAIAGGHNQIANMLTEGPSLENEFIET